MGKRIWLIGESNPYGPDERCALYPAPDGSAGWRLCVQVLGMVRREYLRTFERRNLLHQAKWSVPKSLHAAASVEVEFMRREADAACALRELGAHQGGDGALVLCGARVVRAFGFKDFRAVLLQPGLRTACGSRVLAIPHPSGRSREWDDPDTHRHTST